MFCRKCGSELPDNARFCATCGAPADGAPIGAPQPVPQQAARQAQPHGVAPQPTRAASASAKGTNSKLIGIAALCVVAAAIAAVAIVVAVSRFGGGQPGQDPAVTSAAATDPVTLDYNGTTIKALHRPSFYDGIQTAGFTAATPAVTAYAIEAGLANVTNLDDVYLSDEEMDLLERNGFSVAVGNSGDEFFETYEMNRYHQIPSLVTVDSMMHTYHLYFSHLMKTTERDSLAAAVEQMSDDMLQASLDQLDQLEGTEWEDAALRNVTFFAVGSALFGGDPDVPSSVAGAVDDELDAIYDASGIATSNLTGAEEDYSQYKPRGYYEDSEELESYFRAMMWYGRMNFQQSKEDLDRSALLMTLALNGNARESWESVYAITSFFAGASDDCGYYEYYPIAEAVYGEGVTVADLPGNDEAWEAYHQLTAQMDPPQINSTVVYDDGRDADSMMDDAKGFRFMGQRFSIDEAIFQQLTYRQVGENGSGDTRMMPNALDVPAALGSNEALGILEERGDTEYDGYLDHIDKLRETYADDADDVWNASLYSQWLHTLNPLLQEKGEGYPTFMQSTEWARKSLQTYLGSYTELKHDTVLYSKQMLVEMGGGPEPKDDRGYVEAEPLVFERLARLTEATATGLEGYGMLNDEDRENLARLQELADQLATMANKELQDELLTDAEFDIIREYGGTLEHFWQEVYKHETDSPYFQSREFPAAIVIDVATNPDAGTVLELGTGKASTIRAVVPIDGQLRVATGTVFGFYQFEQPLSDRLTDSEWREIMGTKDVEDWTDGFQYVPESYY